MFNLYYNLVFDKVSCHSYDSKYEILGPELCSVTAESIAIVFDCCGPCGRIRTCIDPPVIIHVVRYDIRDEIRAMKTKSCFSFKILHINTCHKLTNMQYFIFLTIMIVIFLVDL